MNALLLQCGGPTAVVNISLAAAIRRWRIAASGALFGGRYGLAALTTGDWVRLDRDTSASQGEADADDPWLSRIEQTPGMALGGGRARLDDEALQLAVERLAARKIATLFLIGGNGTMAAGRALADQAHTSGVPLRILGIPKTIDNDIPMTDVTPGFPSAARFLIECVRDVAADASSMRGYEDVVLVEAMGRHTGWLAAATQFARATAGEAPHLVLVPEQPVEEEELLESIRTWHARSGVCVATIAEGIRDRSGVCVAEKAAELTPGVASGERGGHIERDARGQIILGRSGGPLPYLAMLVRQRLGLRCRLVRPDVLQRCSRAHVSAFDRRIAQMAGESAVDVALACAPATAVMIALRERGDAWSATAVPLDEVRGERTLSDALQRDPSPLRRLLA